ncbi:MAG: LD-carboxypeptidase [Firmicutes bacterium]|nr:LD-carboxypeptidase [Candidatus Fermentithermobacillaceae bacterium]
MKKKAPSLKQGDVVAIVAPSGAVHKDSLDRGVEILKSLGYRVKMGKSVQKRYGYLAGNDIERAHDFMSAWTDPEVKAVLAARGGYGATRILPNLDFNVLRDHIKILVGFSDITALHLAFWREMRLVTFHGPMVESGTDSSLSVPYNLEGFRQILDGSWRGGELRMPDEAEEGVGPDERPGEGPLVALEGGRASGELVGGNLSLIAALCGTRWDLDTDGKVLFLEEIGERPYRVDRMLCQLKQTGKLDGLRGVLLGDFTDCDPGGSSPSFTVQEVLEQYFRGTGKPCIRGVPAGHGKYRAMLPMGASVEIDADRLTVRFLEQPLSTRNQDLEGNRQLRGAVLVVREASRPHE